LTGGEKAIITGIPILMWRGRTKGKKQIFNWTNLEQKNSRWTKMAMAIGSQNRDKQKYSKRLRRGSMETGEVRGKTKCEIRHASLP
jgi:hypothetical protein